VAVAFVPRPVRTGILGRGHREVKDDNKAALHQPLTFARQAEDPGNMRLAEEIEAIAAIWFNWYIAYMTP
jgi:hypothetical protein